jgi:uncharacterized protein YndB with AHSA1/START domain
MLKKILLALVVVVVAFAILVVLQPDEFRVTRSTTISAPPAAVFDHVNDLRKWQAFSPWAKMDPEADVSFEGAPSGTGAVFTWSGNKEVGEGRMTIIASRPHERILFRLDFYEPFEGTNKTEFTFKPEGKHTLVTWSMTGTNSFMFKAIALFMDCDKMIGGQFEEGLANLKANVESEPRY